MKIQTRIDSIIELLPKGHCVADIGTDHGYLAIKAIDSGKIQSAIASDISAKSLDKAKVNIRTAGYTDKIETCVANGFQHKLFNKIDLAIIAGMGGDLITRIFNQSTDVLQHINTCVVQPMTKIVTLRKWVVENPFCINDEDLVYEKGKLYFVFKIDHQEEMIKRKQSVDEIGTILIDKQHPLLHLYATRKIRELEFKLELLNNAKSEEGMKHRKEVLNQLTKMKELKKWSATFKKL